jgi:GTP-binding protein
MNIQFVKSSNNPNQCPSDQYPEFAFIGRSNVGKSSLINMLAENKGLAKTSVKPGKTQLINHFIVTPSQKEQSTSEKDKSWYLVDLPGYGFAKTSKTNREHFEKLIRNYILDRKNLFSLLVLIDSRLEPQKIDLEFITFLGENHVPFVLIFTKADKISTNQVNNNIMLFKKALQDEWEALPEMFISSSVTKQGKNEILSFIRKAINNA